jgi:hypothetical protein
MWVLNVGGRQTTLSQAIARARSTSDRGNRRFWYMNRPTSPAIQPVRIRHFPSIQMQPLRYFSSGRFARTASARGKAPWGAAQAAARHGVAQPRRLERSLRNLNREDATRMKSDSDQKLSQICELCRRRLPLSREQMPSRCAGQLQGDDVRES